MTNLETGENEIKSENNYYYARKTTLVVKLCLLILSDNADFIHDCV